MTVNLIAIARILALVLTLGLTAPVGVEAQQAGKVYCIGSAEFGSAAPMALRATFRLTSRD